MSVAIALAIWAAIAPVSPQEPASDQLSKCLVARTSSADRIVLVQWVFSVISTSPHVQALSTVTSAQRMDLAKRAGQLFNRLMLTDCRSETVAAIGEGKEEAVEKAFSTLGETAMTDLMSDPIVAKSFTEVLGGFDMVELGKLMIDSGVDLTGKPAKP